MRKIVRYMKKCFENPRRLVMIPFRLGLQYICPDKVFLKILFWSCTRQSLNLKDPKTFNEKLQWLKLYDRNPLYTQLADKYEVRKYVAKTIGEQHLVPLLGVWNRFEEIDFKSMPEQFVLKCTHDSGSVMICRDKSKFDIKRAGKVFEKALRRNSFWFGREWPYKGIKPRVIAEKFLGDASGGVTDYKFYCFNGTPKFLYVSAGLENRETAKISYVTLEWEKGPVSRSDHLEFAQLPPKPVQFEQMRRVAATLSAVSPFLRVDLYEVDGHVFFSELTFTPTGGMTQWAESTHNELLGSWLELPGMS